METIQIDRRRNILPPELRKDYLNGTGRPVIITDAATHWPATTKWTFEFFKSAYGSDLVPICADGIGGNHDVAKLTTLASYINNLETPIDELPGMWVSALDSKPLKAAPSVRQSPAYLMGWRAFMRHPELYEDIMPHPAFIDDWIARLDPTIRDLFETVSDAKFWSVYLGPRNTLSRLHQDLWNTHSCLTQIRGRKRAILFSPEDSGFLYEGQVDPEQPDFERFRLFRQTTAYECVLEPGETLFTPPGWWHHVRSLENSITLSHNFFNEVNVNDYLANLLRRLPKMARVIGKSERIRQALEIEWDASQLIDKLREP